MATVYGSTVSSGYYKGYMTYTTSSTNTSYSVKVSAAGPSSTASSTPTWGSWELTLSATGKTSVTKGPTQHSLSPGAKWDMLGSTKTFTWDKGTSSSSKTVSAKTEWQSTSSTASHTFTVPSLTKYTVKYNANNGSGAPSSQTKYYGRTLTLRTGTPTRTGYNFNGWNTKANGSGTNYSAGGNYTANASATLYAKWTAKTYTIQYNSNGGDTWSDGTTTKTYGKSCTLSSTIPTRSGYVFMGWASSSTAATAQWSAGGTFSTAITATTTLYAVWSEAYVPPQITNFEAYRSDSSGNPNNAGAYVTFSFGWACGRDTAGAHTPTSAAIAFENGTAILSTANWTAQNGTYSKIVAVSLGTTRQIEVTLIDSVTEAEVSRTFSLPPGSVTIHVASTGNNITMFGIANTSQTGLIVNDDVYIDGGLYQLGHSSPLGTTVAVSFTGSISTASTQNVGAGLELAPGNWIVRGYVFYGTGSSTGRRFLTLARTTSNSASGATAIDGAANYRLPISSTTLGSHNTTNWILSLTQTNWIFARLYQNGGKTLGYTVDLRAVRLQ